PQNSRHEASQQQEPSAGGEMRVFVGGEDAEDVVIFVDGFPEVAPFLLVPPVGVGVAELALLGRRLDVAAILYGRLWGVRLGWCMSVGRKV
ncbi:MAG: hypothetical protein Q9211_005870, partial [Gyalolechia sp. 1 TL-2023]